MTIFIISLASKTLTNPPPNFPPAHFFKLPSLSLFKFFKTIYRINEGQFLQNDRKNKKMLRRQ